jgi:hypothetical protein
MHDELAIFGDQELQAILAQTHGVTQVAQYRFILSGSARGADLGPRTP